MTTKTCDLCGKPKDRADFAGCWHNRRRVCRACQAKRVSPHTPDVCMIRQCTSCQTVYAHPDHWGQAIRYQDFSCVCLAPSEAFHTHYGKLRSQCKTCRKAYAQATSKQRWQAHKARHLKKALQRG